MTILRSLQTGITCGLVIARANIFNPLNISGLSVDNLAILVGLDVLKHRASGEQSVPATFRAVDNHQRPSGYPHAVDPSHRVTLPRLFSSLAAHLPQQKGGIHAIQLTYQGGIH
ncbi:Uncharacterised protein [Yersinia frederiksenii]|nr:Uncharacterised protein [Yersinia frederiksenii]